MAAAAWRRARVTACASASSTSWRKIAGIIRYVEPLPTPVATKSSMNAAKNNPKLCRLSDQTTPSTPTAIATKLSAVTLAPPTRSASLPPSGRISEPTRAPRKA